MWGVVDVVFGALALALGVRLLAGWSRAVRWAPEGDPRLVEAMSTTRPRVSSRTAVAVIDLSIGREKTQRAFNRCDVRRVFEIGSVTKVFTGLLLADAIERGELRPDTALGEPLPELAGYPAATATFDDVAHHRSGLPRTPLGATAGLRMLLFAYLGLDPYRGLRLPALLRITRRARLRGIGTERYSNLGAALVGHSVARGAGSNYPDLLAERITSPLAMNSTSAEPTRPRHSGRGWFGSWAQPWRLDGYGPAGAVTSTLDDMVLLVRALLDGSCPGAAAMDQALFWQIHTTSQGHRRICHTGETGGYSAYLAVYPEVCKGVVVMSVHANAEYQQKLAAACMNTGGP